MKKALQENNMRAILQDILKKALIAALSGVAVSIATVVLWLSQVALMSLSTSAKGLNMVSWALTISMSLNLVFAAWILGLKRASMLKLRFGVYWDREKNPYCPSCKSPLSGYSEYHEGNGFMCSQCDKIILLMAKDGSNLPYRQAMEILSQ